MAATRVCELSVVVYFACCALPKAENFASLEGAGTTLLNVVESTLLEVLIWK